MTADSEVLNLKHIINFIADRWQLTKRDIAKVYFPYYGHTKLSKTFYVNQETLNQLFEQFFNFKNENSVAVSQIDSSSSLLEALKSFMDGKGYKDALEDVWDKSYDDFVKELLQRANKKPIKSKSLGKEEISRLLMIILCRTQTMPLLLLTIVKMSLKRNCTR
jgi:hypothetical protein